MSSFRYGTALKYINRVCNGKCILFKSYFLEDVITSDRAFSSARRNERIRSHTSSSEIKHSKTSIRDIKHTHKEKVSRNLVRDINQSYEASHFSLPSRMLGLQNRMKADPFGDNRDLKNISAKISEFPVSIILRTESVASIPIKELVNFIEQTNKEYNINIYGKRINCIDPNDYQLLQDYSILKKPSLLTKYFTNAGLNKKIAFTFLYGMQEHQEVFVIHMTELGFRKSSFFLHEFSSKFAKYFKASGCILNAPKFPVITLVKRPNDSTTNEDKIMADNLYTLATLGLVHVTKMQNRNLVLTHKQAESRDTPHKIKLQSKRLV